MTVAIEDRAGVRVLTLERPPVNAVDLDLAQALLGALEAASGDASCRALVLTGSPGVFSAGIDTREVPAYDPPTRATMLRTVNRMVLELYALPRPVVAAISGHALGAALVLALACDVRFAARGPFRLGFTEAAAGIPFPAGPLTVVRAELSPHAARVLALGARPLPPDSADLAAVVDRVVEPSELLAAAVAEADRLAALPAYVRVKTQLRAPTVDVLRRIVDTDDEPLLTGWV
jgi:enoyl-CoA hydratase